jgi:two-component system chemotaxis sensor kinase CheA
MDLNRYAELFLTESQEHLQAINESLLVLERDGFDAASVDRFFRAVHTIKGMSATMGYTAVAQLSHEMESLLSDVRDGSRSLDGDLLDPLFLATDALETAVGLCASGRQDAVDVAEALAVIAGARSGAGSRSGSAGGGAATPLIASQAELTGVPSDATRVQVRLRRDTPLPGVRALLIVGRLKSIGEVLSVVPDDASITSDRFDGVFTALIRTEKSPEELRLFVASLGDVDVVNIGDVEQELAPQPEAAAPGLAGAAAGAPARTAAAPPPPERRPTQQVRN